MKNIVGKFSGAIYERGNDQEVSYCRRISRIYVSKQCGGDCSTLIVLEYDDAGVKKEFM